MNREDINNELINKYCKTICKCYVERSDGKIECLNTWGCPYNVISNDYGLD